MAYEYEADEWRAAVRDMSDADRVVACGHTGRGRGACPDCGDTPAMDEVL